MKHSVDIYFDSGKLKAYKKIFILFLCFIGRTGLYAQTTSKEDFCNQISERFRHDQGLTWAKSEKDYTGNKDSIKIVYAALRKENTNIVQSFFYKYGLPCILDYSTDCLTAFWVIMIHSTSVPIFQKDVIKWAETHDRGKYVVKKYYALLVDKRRVLDSLPQIYGTQLQIDTLTSTIRPYPIYDSIHVDERRDSMDLQPLKEYLYGAKGLFLK